MENSQKIEERIKKLAGNQARIVLLRLLYNDQLDKVSPIDLEAAFEVGESYRPELLVKGG